MTTIVTIAVLFFVTMCILRLPAVRVWHEERRRKEAEDAFRRTAEMFKSSGTTKEDIRKSLCESGGTEGVAPYFGLTPEEIEECRQARIKYKAETARKVGNFGKFLESLPKEDPEDSDSKKE